jgi:hypothetical protein
MRMALEAGKWLVAYADNRVRLESAESKPAMDARAEVIAELRGLYAKALAPMGSLVREAEAFEPRGGLEPREKSVQKLLVLGNRDKS